MNTLGKILVILNFLFALVVGAFLAIDFATRQNWKTQIDAYKKELDVARANSQAMSDTFSGLDAQIKAARSDLEAKKLELSLQQAEFASKVTELQNQFKEAEQRSKASDVIMEKAIAAQDRMKQELEQNKKVVEDREDRLVKLHKVYTESQNLVQSLDRDLKFTQERNQILVSRVQELEKYLAELQTGGSKEGGAPRGLNAENPPARFVKGVVERVDKDDKGLVRISLGTDHGLRVNNTLEVYRTNPVEYVGLIRIEDAHHHTSVARFIQNAGKNKQIREGDIVSSSLSPR
jgi:hypothetical protein